MDCEVLRNAMCTSEITIYNCIFVNMYNKE